MLSHSVLGDNRHIPHVAPERGHHNTSSLGPHRQGGCLTCTQVPKYPSDVLTEYSTGITAAPGPRLFVCQQRVRTAFRADSEARHAHQAAGRKCGPIGFLTAFTRSEQVVAPAARTSVRTAGLRHPRSAGTSSPVVLAQITTRAGVARVRG